MLPEVMLYLLQVAWRMSRLPEMLARSLREELWVSQGPGTRLIYLIQREELGVYWVGQSIVAVLVFIVSNMTGGLQLE